MSEKQQQQQPPTQQQQQQPPPYTGDLLAPPQWQGPAGQLIPWKAPNHITAGSFSIHGDDSQVLQVTLPPGGFINGQPGCMMHMADNIKMETALSGGLVRAFKRALASESAFQNRFVNKSQQPASVALGPDFPSKIIPVDLSRSGPISAGPGLYMAHLGEAKITYRFLRNCLAGCFGGSGFLLLKMYGTGTVFLNGSGTIMEKILAPGEVLLVDSDAVVAFAETVNYDVRRTGGCLTCFCGGEGLFNTVLTGPGLVVLQSMCMQKLRRALKVPGNAQNAAAGAAGGAAMNAAM